MSALGGELSSFDEVWSMVGVIEVAIGVLVAEWEGEGAEARRPRVMRDEAMPAAEGDADAAGLKAVDDAAVFGGARELARGEMRVLFSKRHDDAVLGGYWEFPGGKVEAGESREACVVRELKEELGIGR